MCGIYAGAFSGFTLLFSAVYVITRAVLFFVGSPAEDKPVDLRVVFVFSVCGLCCDLACILIFYQISDSILGSHGHSHGFGGACASHGDHEASTGSRTDHRNAAPESCRQEIRASKVDTNLCGAAAHALADLSCSLVTAIGSGFALAMDLNPDTTDVIGSILLALLMITIGGSVVIQAQYSWQVLRRSRQQSSDSIQSTQD